MNITLVVREGEDIARPRKTGGSLRIGEDFAIVTCRDGYFSEWQIEDLLKHLRGCRRALGKNKSKA